MPSLSHEALVTLFRNRPALAPELLRQALAVQLPAYSEVRIDSAELSQLVPPGYHADLVVLLVEGRPVLAIVVEVQLGLDERKRFTWPLYQAGLRANLECPACVLVVTPYAEVAEWASSVIETGPTTTFRPLVLGPKAVPVVTNRSIAEAVPELAVLSAMAHGAGDPETAAKIGFAALGASLGLDDERALLYSDLIRVSLADAARKALEALMASMQGYEYQSEFHRRAEAETRAQAVLEILEARDIALTLEQREQIGSCSDLDTLRKWVKRAATIWTADELFK
jgi:hypothetical protein